jgi:hypothetical protein
MKAQRQQTPGGCSSGCILVQEARGRVGLQSKTPENCGFRWALCEGHQIGIWKDRNRLAAASRAGAAQIRAS